MDIKLYNTLSLKKEIFKPIEKNKVGLYTCGPTVYDYAHIGNLRTYIFEDILKRVLKYNEYEVKHVMNITDVGHLTGDMDMGEDKLEKGAKREGKTALEIAKFYTEVFLSDLKELNIEMPDEMPKATDYIKEQIEMISVLENKNYTYKTSDGIYFDTSKFENYNKLSHQNLKNLQEGARVEKNDEKKNATDFALWKFSPKNEKRQMEWDSPWGVGFPGWHVECSAMSMAVLKNQLDIHCGGIDHINIHHTNEIAQSEAATGKQFFNYWMHGEFLVIDKQKMAKSTGTFITLQTLKEKGYNPLAYRFFLLNAHYKSPVNFSFEALDSAVNGLNHLYNQVRNLETKKIPSVDDKTLGVNSEFKNKFLEAINDDLNIPKALAVVQELLKSSVIADGSKLTTILDFDKVLGLGLDKSNIEINAPQEVIDLAEKREIARKGKNWGESDDLREKIRALGFEIEDTDNGYILKR